MSKSYSHTTHSIRVDVTPIFLNEESSPVDGRYFWAYEVAIENQGTETVQLMERVWWIIDARGHTQEVRGAGVVGQQPVLDPGDVFSYTSGTPLATASGFMKGLYRMRRQDGNWLDVTIPAFSLDSPYDSATIN